MCILGYIICVKKNLKAVSGILNWIVLFFLHNRCPETANVRRKMLYAASKDALKKKLVGMTHEIQATEYADLALKDVTEKVMCKMVK